MWTNTVCLHSSMLYMCHIEATFLSPSQRDLHSRHFGCSQVSKSKAFLLSCRSLKATRWRVRRQWRFYPTAWAPQPPTWATSMWPRPWFARQSWASSMAMKISWPTSSLRPVVRLPRQFPRKMERKRGHQFIKEEEEDYYSCRISRPQTGLATRVTYTNLVWFCWYDEESMHWIVSCSER